MVSRKLFSIFHDVIYKLQATLKICKLFFLRKHLNSRFNGLEGRVINSEIPSFVLYVIKLWDFQDISKIEYNSLFAQPPPKKKRKERKKIYIYTS